MKRLLQGVTAAVFGVAMAATSAHALSLSPGGEIPGLTFTNNNCDAACVSAKLGITVTEAYKAESVRHRIPVPSLVRIQPNLRILPAIQLISRSPMEVVQALAVQTVTS